MLKLKTTTQFRKDYKRMKKQGKDMTLLQHVIDDLLLEKTLDVKFRDHALWLLIYVVDHGQLILTASRTGTHSDLFNE